MNDNSQNGNIVRLLDEKPFMDMFTDFSWWRIDNFVRQMDARRSAGRVLPFVRGLRLSAHLIYAIRKNLAGTDLTANWGHLLDKSGGFCSRECDVIIHHEGPCRQWNGNREPVMDFRFVEQQEAVVVISCKSYIRSGDIDTEYCELMKPFVKKIWLFAECCGPRSAESIEKKAREFGYKKFWYLYKWSKQTDPEPNRNGWNKFVKEVRKLKR
ncbi:MAG: hypothetical protein KAV87_16185 [Desulfobacteraceae bacterium]|jgi:hypothetical protein|nr:hypothetical protein [Desulfobacteraceae bacterium]